MPDLRVLKPTRKLGHYRYLRFGVTERTANRIDKLKAAAERHGHVLDVEVLLRAGLDRLLQDAEADLADLDARQAAKPVAALAMAKGKAGREGGEGTREDADEDAGEGDAGARAAAEG